MNRVLSPVRSGIRRGATVSLQDPYDFLVLNGRGNELVNVEDYFMRGGVKVSRSRLLCKLLITHDNSYDAEPRMPLVDGFRAIVNGYSGNMENLFYIWNFEIEYHTKEERQRKIVANWSNLDTTRHDEIEGMSLEEFMSASMLWDGSPGNIFLWNGRDGRYSGKKVLRRIRDFSFVQQMNRDNLSLLNEEYSESIRNYFSGSLPSDFFRVFYGEFDLVVSTGNEGQITKTTVAGGDLWASVAVYEVKEGRMRFLAKSDRKFSKTVILAGNNPSKEIVFRYIKNLFSSGLSEVRLDSGKISESFFPQRTPPNSLKNLCHMSLQSFVKKVDLVSLRL